VRDRRTLVTQTRQVHRVRIHLDCDATPASRSSRNRACGHRIQTPPRGPAPPGVLAECSRSDEVPHRRVASGLTCWAFFGPAEAREAAFSDHRKEPEKKSRFSDEQIVKILREVDQSTVAEVAKKHGVSEQTIYVWKRRFGGLEVADAKRLCSLEVENNRLKKLLAERDLEVEVMKEVAAKKW
jgi:putative transposase